MDHSVELIDLAPAPWEQAFMRTWFWKDNSTHSDVVSDL